MLFLEYRKFLTTLLKWILNMSWEKWVQNQFVTWEVSNQDTALIAGNMNSSWNCCLDLTYFWQ